MICNIRLTFDLLCVKKENKTRRSDPAGKSLIMLKIFSLIPNTSSDCTYPSPSSSWLLRFSLHWQLGKPETLGELLELSCGLNSVRLSFLRLWHLLDYFCINQQSLALYH